MPIPVTPEIKSLLSNFPPAIAEVAGKYYADKYKSGADEYAACRDEVVKTIGGEAMLLTETMRDTFTHEIVTWRVNSAQPGNGDRNFSHATRARLGVTLLNRWVRRVPPDCIVPHSLRMREIVAGHLQRAPGAPIAMLVHTMEYKEILLRPEGSLREGRAMLLHENRLFSADPAEGKPVSFPVLPSYESIAAEAYGAHCAEKSAGMPETAELARLLADASRLDGKGKYQQVDQLDEYARLESKMPPESRQLVPKLTEALYACDTLSEGLPPGLVAVLANPYVMSAARLAYLNSGSYFRQTQKSAHARPLPAQLRVIANKAADYQVAVKPVVGQEQNAFAAHLETALTRARQVAEEARQFAAHLAAPRTLPLRGEEWRVRPR